MEASSPDAGQSQELKFEHTGRIGELAPMAFVIALLNIVTLSFYRFWGKTRVRRYLWGHTWLLGEPLEYTGTAMELLKGFLIVLFVVLVPLVVASNLIDWVWLGTMDSAYAIANLAYFVVITLLIGIGQYRARRYRVGRTAWRGIHGGQSGSATRYGFMILGFYALLLFSLGWTYPWQSVCLTSYEWNNTWFGDRRFSFKGKSGPLYRRFAITWTMLFGTVLLVSSALIYAFLGTALMNHAKIGLDALSTGTWLIILAVALVSPLAFVWYRVGEYRYMSTRTEYEGLTFGFETTVGRLIRLSVGNFLIILLTLGFGYPVAQMRRFRFYCDHLWAEGSVEFDVIRQNMARRTGKGEGLADAFDIDAV